MEATDLRTEFTKETKTRFNTEWLAYNDYVAWLEQRLVKLLTIPPISQQSELLKAFCSMLLNAGDLTQQISDDDINSFIKAFNCA